MKRDKRVPDNEGAEREEDRSRPAHPGNPQRAGQPQDDGDGGGERTVLGLGASKIGAAHVVGGVQDRQDGSHGGHHQHGHGLETRIAAGRVRPRNDSGHRGHGTGHEEGDEHGGDRKALVLCIDIDLPGGGDEVGRGDDAEFDERDQSGGKDAEPEVAPGEVKADQPDDPHQPGHHHVDDVDVGAVEFVTEIEGAEPDREQARHQQDQPSGQDERALGTSARRTRSHRRHLTGDAGDRSPGPRPALDIIR